MTSQRRISLDLALATVLAQEHGALTGDAVVRFLLKHRNKELLCLFNELELSPEGLLAQLQGGVKFGKMDTISSNAQQAFPTPEVGAVDFIYGVAVEGNSITADWLRVHGISAQDVREVGAIVLDLPLPLNADISASVNGPGATVGL